MSLSIDIKKIYKYCLYFCSLILLTQLFTLNVLAGEDYSMLTNGYQYALVLGKIVKKENNSLLFIVTQSLKGTKTERAIKINLDKPHHFNYFDNLKVNDFLLASIDKGGLSENNYEVNTGLYKVTSLDYKNLKVLPSSGDNTLVSNMLLGWFVNSSKNIDGLNIIKKLSDTHSIILSSLINKNRMDKSNLAIATIEKVNLDGKEKSLVINIKKIISGKAIKKSKINVILKNFSGAFYKPQNKDSILLNMLKIDENNYKITSDDCLLKTSSTNYKDLKIVNSFFDKEKEYIKALEWFLHSNGKENDFYFPDGKLAVKRADNSFLIIN